MVYRSSENSINVPFLIFLASIVMVAMLSLCDAAAKTPQAIETKRYADFVDLASSVWGEGNVWLPSSQMWVQYEEDLGERSAVDFEKGIATVQILLDPEMDHTRSLDLSHLRQGVGNLILRDGVDPLEMVETFIANKKRPVQRGQDGKKIPPDTVLRVYITKKGDSLWKIARRFYMTPEELAKINEIELDTVLSVGRPLKVKIFASHDLTLEPEYPKPGNNSPLIDQIRMVDDSPVPHYMVKDFAAEVVAKSLKAATIEGADGIRRKVVTVTFSLVSNHVEIRGRKFFPLVKEISVENNLDPALIMAIIHTESMFNPRAKSITPAYGRSCSLSLTPGRGKRIPCCMGKNKKYHPNICMIRKTILNSG